MKLYRAVDVWRRCEDGRVVRYRCFEVLPSGGFCVQSADFYTEPVADGRVRGGDRQLVELFCEEAPDVRSRTYPSLERAIDMHDKEFR